MKQGINKFVKYWALYDFSNSSYVLVFQSFLFPIFFSTILSNNGVSLSDWGLINGFSTILGALLSIIVGKYADKSKRINVLGIFILFSFIGMLLLSIFVEKNLSLVPIFYIITNTFFITTLSLSDSILPYVSKNKNDTLLNSGFAWGIGYLGGIVSLICVLIIQKFTSEYSMFVFLSVAIFYFIFSFIAINGLKKIKLNSKEKNNKCLEISKGEEGIMLFGFWLVSESITVVLLFYSIYASLEIGLNNFQIAITLLMVQIIGIPSTYFGGKYAFKYKNKLMFSFGTSIILWFIIILLLIYTKNIYGLFFIVLFTGLVIGNSQAYLRSIYSLTIDKSKSGEKFGIFSLVSQAGVIVGPFIFGFASDKLGSQKIPLLFLGILMIIGFILISYIYSKAEKRKIKKTE